MLYCILLDNEGFSPLSLLSKILSCSLSEAKCTLECTNILVYGKAEFQLGIPLPSKAAEVKKPKIIEFLAGDINIHQIAANKYHSVALCDQGKIYSW